MTLPAGTRQVIDADELRTFYADAPAAHVYALVDLEEPFWSGSRWYRRGDAVVGIVAMPNDEAMAVYAVSTRDPEGCLALVVDLLPAMPPGLLITGPVGLGAAVRPHRDVAWDGPHTRYHLIDASALPSPDARVVPLGPADLPALRRLYDSDPGAAFFLPHMIDDASFVGVKEEDELVAAAGTHVLSEAQRCAAIGAVYTRPSHRGTGLGAAVTGGVVRRIADRVDVIGLNVASDNDPARRIYERLGFAPVLRYDECELC